MEQTFWASLDRDDIQVFGINNGEDISVSRDFAETFGLTFPVLHDGGSQVYGQYSIQGITPYPRDCIIDQNGIVRYLHSEYDPQVMLQTIDALLLSELEEEPPTGIPGGFNLRAFPNPFNPQTTIQYQIKDASTVDLTVYDVLGQQVKKIVHRGQEAGEYSVDFIATGLPSGLYFVRLRTKNASQMVKIMLMK